MNNGKVVRRIFSSSWSNESNDNINRNNSHIAKKLEEILPLTTQSISFEEGLDYILSHFEEPVWPRTIFTHTLGKQVPVFNKKQALSMFRESNFLDCRINAYPDSTGFGGLNRQAPNFIFIDIDRATFDTDKKFKLAVSNTCTNIKEILGGYPTILSTVNGVHIFTNQFKESY